jgi:hypothetical protein
MYFDQFKTFNPVSGEVPHWPFSYLPDVASRARSLLLWRWRTTEQMEAAARRITGEIDAYFTDMKYMELLRLREEAGSPGGAGIVPDEPDDDELDVPTWTNSSEVDAFKAVIERRDDYGFFSGVEPEPLTYPEGKDYELFAVLSLWMLADALRDLQHGKNPLNLSIAAEYALKAMDAVCHAEHLYEMQHLKESVDRSIATMRSNLEVERQVEERGKRSKQSEKMNEARHRKTNEAKAKVTEEWGKDPSRWAGAERASSDLANWLSEQGFREFQPRTVAKWIRDYAKEKRVRLR